MTNRTKIRMRFTRKTYLILFAVSLLIISLTIPFLNYFSIKLSKTEKVEANILLVEGWISPDALRLAHKEFVENDYDFLVTTGLNSPEFCQVSNNGNLVFYTDSILNKNTDDAQHKIEVVAFSHLEGEHCAHFNFIANNTFLADYYADTDIKKYGASWKGKLSDLDSVIVQFTNDALGDFGDRNLYVSKLIIDDSISIPVQFNTIYKIPEPEGERWLYNNYSSYAHIAQIILLEFGVDSSKIMAISGGKALVNRTLTSAYAFSDWLQESNRKIEGINVLTEGEHAYRSYMIYKEIIPSKYPVGVISYSSQGASGLGKHKYLNTLRELIAIGYYKIILLFRSGSS